MIPIIINKTKHKDTFDVQYAEALQIISNIKDMFGIEVSKLSIIKDNLIQSSEKDLDKVRTIQEKLEKLEDLFLQV